MAKNEFLPFATADGANVLSAEDYQTLRSRSNGFSAGVARSQELNTVWRQASVMAHVIAQFIADTNNSNVADDGDLDKLQAGLIQALSKNVNNTVPAASLKTAGIVQLSSTTDSDSETMAATPKAVKAAMDLAASSAVKSVNGKQGEVALTAGDVGALARTGGTLSGNLSIDSGGRKATFQNDGNIKGPAWGGYLNEWVNKNFVKKGRLTGLIWTGNIGNDQKTFGDGVVVVGIQSTANYATNLTVAIRYLQLLVDDTWVSVAND